MRRALARRLRDERGYTIVELLTVAALLPVIIGSALTTFTSFNQTVARNQALAESQGRTREAVDQLARDLRNLASPTLQLTPSVDSASAYDLVFKTVDASGPGGADNPGNVKRVRYCLDTSTTGPASLYSQTQTWTTPVPPPTPSTADCPDAAWPGTARTLTTGVTNRVDGQNRPVFQYNSAVTNEVSAIVVQAWVKAEGVKEAREGLLRSQMYLRNQNRPPTADFDAKPTTPGTVRLNGSASADPDEDQLTYSWHLDGGAAPAGTGVVFDLATTTGVHQVTLKVFDGELAASITKAVNVL